MNVDLREQLLPSEKLLNQYDNILVDNKKGNIYLTNLRLFLSTKKNIWNFNTKDIAYMGRMNNPRFSWVWQLPISFMLLYSIFSGMTLIFLICMILSAARQYLKIDCLEIGLENKKWIISDDNGQLDELMFQIQTNQVTGLQKNEGKPVVDAEEMLNTEIKINIIGENESGPLRSAWISLSFAFLFYYLNSFRDSGSVWLFVLLISALCSYIIYKDRRNTNLLRDVEPEDGLVRKGWYFILKKLNIEIIKADYSVNLYNTRINIRNLGYILSSIILLLAFTVTHINSNLIPMLYGVSFAISVYMLGRCLAGIPRSRTRMIARSFACAFIAICVILPCLSLAPLYMPANALLPPSFLNNENGWEKSYSQVDEYGLGLASTSIYLYTDDAKDNEGNEDGYPAILFIIVLKMPFEIDETVPLDILNDQFQKMAIEQDIELESKLESGNRQTSQGYETEYVIYNGTAKTEKIGTEEINYKVTKGSKSKYIGEVWKAPEYNLLIVSMGIGIISSETFNEDTGIDPIDDLIDDIIPNPTDTTDEKNWNEMVSLIPEIYCYQEDWEN